VALLVFLSRAARTRIVAADLVAKTAERLILVVVQQRWGRLHGNRYLLGVGIGGR
jgi:hypothetical protein